MDLLCDILFLSCILDFFYFDLSLFHICTLLHRHLMWVWQSSTKSDSMSPQAKGDQVSPRSINWLSLLWNNIGVLCTFSAHFPSPPFYAVVDVLCLKMWEPLQMTPNSNCYKLLQMAGCRVTCVQWLIMNSFFGGQTGIYRILVFRMIAGDCVCVMDACTCKQKSIKPNAP